MNGYNCDLNETALLIKSDITNRTDIISRKPYRLANFSNLVDPYTIYYQNINIPLLKPKIKLLNCGEQVYQDINKPYLCKDGSYQSNINECKTHMKYKENGNGCINQLDASPAKLQNIDAFRCKLNKKKIQNKKKTNLTFFFPRCM